MIYINEKKNGKLINKNTYIIVSKILNINLHKHQLRSRSVIPNRSHLGGTSNHHEYKLFITIYTKGEKMEN